MSGTIQITLQENFHSSLRLFHPHIAISAWNIPKLTLFLRKNCIHVKGQDFYFFQITEAREYSEQVWVLQGSLPLNLGNAGIRLIEHQVFIKTILRKISFQGFFYLGKIFSLLLLLFFFLPYFLRFYPNFSFYNISTLKETGQKKEFQRKMIKWEKKNLWKYKYNKKTRKVKTQNFSRYF